MRFNGAEREQFGESYFAKVFGQETIDGFNKYIHEVDDVADEATRYIREAKDGLGRKQLQTMIEHGVDAVENPPPELVRFIEQTSHVPDWVDWEQLERGAMAYSKAVFVGPLSMMISMIGAFIDERPAQVAVHTGHLLKRYESRMMETSIFTSEAMNPGSMKPGNNGHSVCLHVRLAHSWARTRVKKAETWDYGKWGEPVNLYDLAAGQFYLFTYLYLTIAERFGIRFSQQEKDDIYALWRYITYVLGCPDKLMAKCASEGYYKSEILTSMINVGPAVKQASKRFIEASGSIDRLFLAQRFGEKAASFITNSDKYIDFKYAAVRHVYGDEIANALDIPRPPLIAKLQLKVFRLLVSGVYNTIGKKLTKGREFSRKLYEAQQEFQKSYFDSKKLAGQIMDYS